MENKINSIVQLLVALTLFLTLNHFSGDIDSAKAFSKILLIGGLTLPLLYYRFTSLVMQIISSFIVSGFIYTAFYFTNPNGLELEGVSITLLDMSILSFSTLVLLISWIYSGYVVEKSWALWEMITLILMSIIFLYTNIHSGWFGVMALILMINTKSIFHKELDGKLVTGLLILMSALSMFTIYAPENSLLSSPAFVALTVPLLVIQLSLNNTFKIILLLGSFLLFSIGHIHILEPLGGPTAVVYFVLGLGISSLFSKEGVLRLVNQILIIAGFFVLPLINQTTEADTLFEEKTEVVQTSKKSKKKPKWSTSSLTSVENKSITLSPENTVIGFKLDAVGSKVKGEFKQVSGNVSFAKDAMKFKATLPIDGIYTKISARDNSIKKDAEFFDMANYPSIEINYEGTITTEEQYKITPIFTIKGKSKKLPLSFSIQESDDKIQISGKATINRLDFNMKESNDIDNEVLVMFKVEFDK